MMDIESDFDSKTPSLPSEAVVLGIAERTGTDPTELPSLYETIDPDALDSVVRWDASSRVTFEYAGYEVTAEPHRITIHEILPEAETRGDDAVPTEAVADDAD